MAEDKPLAVDFEEIAADIEAGQESGSDEKFWECAEHLLGEMHKNRRILEMAGDVEARGPASLLPMDPVDRLKNRVHQLVFDLADLPGEEQQDVLKSLLDEIEGRLGWSSMETLMQMIGARLGR